jgi:hypothetical protein
VSSIQLLVIAAAGVVAAAQNASANAATALDLIIVLPPRAWISTGGAWLRATGVYSRPWRRGAVAPWRWHSCLRKLWLTMSRPPASAEARRLQAIAAIE